MGEIRKFVSIVLISNKYSSYHFLSFLFKIYYSEIMLVWRRMHIYRFRQIGISGSWRFVVRAGQRFLNESLISSKLPDNCHSKLKNFDFNFWKIWNISASLLLNPNFLFLQLILLVFDVPFGQSQFRTTYFDEFFYTQADHWSFGSIIFKTVINSDLHAK